MVSSMTGSKKDKTCLVCSDRALGYNFNAISCESCKAFFRRNAFKTLRGRCEGKCDITVESRSFCKRCRLSKCFEIGMRKDMILTDEQKKVRKQKIITNKLRKQGVCSEDDDVTTYGYRDSTVSDDTFIADEFMVKECDVYKDAGPPPPDEPMEQIAVKQEGTDFAGRPLTTALPVATAPLSASPNPSCNCYLPWVEAQNIVQESISHLDTNDQFLVNEVIHAHELSFFMTVATPMKSTNLSSPAEFINLAECSVRRMIKFAKTVEMFKLISKDDQIALLKGAVVEVMMLRSAINYDPYTETWSLNTLSCLSNGIATGTDRINAQALKMANPETRKTYSEYSSYIKSLMIVIHGDLVILKLLIVMALFSADRANVVDKEKIQKVQEKYALVLQNYIRFRFPDEKSLFARAIMKLTEIRDINETHSQMMLKMKLEDIEPLMIEIFDLPT